ncbi:MAG TPA: helix-turn-helix domain-containing protein [Ktedonobacterales bacterium]|nr:helix-turn-helix domain-containing protein [Ktedonobacterales bacterium]
MVFASALARPPSSQDPWPHESFDDFAYVAVTLRHVRPLDLLQVEVLHCLDACQTPLSLHALSAQMRFSPATVIWLLSPLLQHGMVKRLPLSRSSAEEKEAAR